MKKVQNFWILVAILALSCATTIPLAPSAVMGEDAVRLISVKHLGINPVVDINSLNTSAAIKNSDQYFLINTLDSDDAAAADGFLLQAHQDLTLEFHAIDDFSPQGEAILGEELAAYPLQSGEVFCLRHLVSEGMPNLLVCAKTSADTWCWAPRFSGLDGSLELDPGFILQQEE